MFVTVTTTITTQIDIDTFEPTHSVDIESSDDIPTQVIYAAVEGACKATLNSIPSSRSTSVQEDADAT